MKYDAPVIELVLLVWYATSLLLVHVYTNTNSLLEDHVDILKYFWSDQEDILL